MFRLPPERDDPHNLERFVWAQKGIYDEALEQIRRGLKTSHWMWFVFPQLRGLGASATSHSFGIASLAEARAYLDHEVLGGRLRACAAAAAELEGLTATQVFGSPDDQKLRSSLTLFEAAKPRETVFALALERLCAGARDPLTLRMLGK